MSALVAAIDRGDVAQYVNNLFNVFLIMIISWIVISWVVNFRGSLPYWKPLRVVVDFIESAVLPYLAIFRRFLPTVGAGGMMLDLSPIVGILVLFLLEGIVVGLIGG